jgi:hypothetical protein
MGRSPETAQRFLQARRTQFRRSTGRFHHARQFYLLLSHVFRLIVEQKKH